MATGHSETLRILVEMQGNAELVAKRLQNELRKLSYQVKQTSKDTAKIPASTKKAAVGFKQLRTQAVSSLEKIRKSVFNLKTALLTIATGLGIGTLAKSFLEAGISMDRMRRGMNAAVGSVEKGSKSIEFLRRESKRLGLVFQDQIKSFQQLSAAAKGTTVTHSQVEQIFLGVGEAATTMQLGQAQAKFAMYALQQMISKGVVSMEELRRQLGDQIPGAFQIAARAMNTTTQELIKMVETGNLASDIFLPRFGAQLRKEFGAAAVEAAKSAQSAINRLKNAWFELRVAVMDSGVTMAFADTINEIVTSIYKWLKQNEALIRQKVPIYLEKMRKIVSALGKGLKVVNTIFQAYVRIVSALPTGAINYFDNLTDSAGKAKKAVYDLDYELQKLSGARFIVIPPPDPSSIQKITAFLNSLWDGILDIMRLGLENTATDILSIATQIYTMIKHIFLYLGKIIENILTIDIVKLNTGPIKRFYDTLIDDSLTAKEKIKKIWSEDENIIDFSGIGEKFKEDTKALISSTKELDAELLRIQKAAQKTRDQNQAEFDKRRKERFDKLSTPDFLSKTPEFDNTLLEETTQRFLDRLKSESEMKDLAEKESKENELKKELLITKETNKAVLNELDYRYEQGLVKTDKYFQVKKDLLIKSAEEEIQINKKIGIASKDPKKEFSAEQEVIKRKIQLTKDLINLERDNLKSLSEDRAKIADKDLATVEANLSKQEALTENFYSERKITVQEYYKKKIELANEAFENEIDLLNKQANAETGIDEREKLKLQNTILDKTRAYTVAMINLAGEERDAYKSAYAEMVSQSDTMWKTIIEQRKSGWNTLKGESGKYLEHLVNQYKIEYEEFSKYQENQVLLEQWAVEKRKELLNDYMMATDDGYRILSELSQRTAEAIEQSFSNYLFDAMTGKFEHWRDAVTGILRSFQRIAADVLGQIAKEWLINQAKKLLMTGQEAKMAAQKITMLAAESAAVGELTAAYIALGIAKMSAGMAGGTGVGNLLKNAIPGVGMAEGGMVPGISPHPKADNIPINATAKEFVHPVDAVKYYGLNFMEGIRQKLIPRELFSGVRIPSISIRRPRFNFAEGGEVTTVKEATVTTSKQTEYAPEINILNIPDPSLVESYLATPEGHNMIVNVISEKSDTIRRVLG